MKLYVLRKVQVRIFAVIHGVSIRMFKGGVGIYYLKADWEAARKKAEKNSTSTKAKRKWETNSYTTHTVVNGLKLPS